MSEKTKALIYIEEAEKNLQCARALLEQEENKENFFHALKQVEFAKDTLSDAREILANCYHRTPF